MGGPGSGPRKLPSTTLKEAISNLEGDIPGIIEELKKLTYGKPVKCECGREVVKQIDREAAIYLIDRVLGKPAQRTELDITERIVLTSVQIDKIMQRYQLAQRLMLPAPSTSDKVSIETVDKVSTE